MYNIDGKLALINLLLWLALLLYYCFTRRYSFSLKKNYILFFMMAIMFATFGFAEADTYHYHEIYDEMLKYNEPIHVEQFYFWLIKHLPRYYYLWRLSIWGAALLLLIQTFKRYELNPTAVLLIFPIILLQQFTVTRGCLGIALFLYSLTYIIKPIRNRSLSFFLGFLGIILSLSLHRSLPLFAAIFILSLMPLNKSTLLVLLALFPLLRELVLPYVIGLLGTGVFSDETVGFASHYMDAERSVANFNGIIRMIVDYTPRILIFYYLIKEYVFKRNKLPRPIRIMFQYSFVLFYIALLFMGQETSSFVTNRTIHMMCFPLAITLIYIMADTPKTAPALRAALGGFILSDLYAFCYTIYKTW